MAASNENMPVDLMGKQLLATQHGINELLGTAEPRDRTAFFEQEQQTLCELRLSLINRIAEAKVRTVVAAEVVRAGNPLGDYILEKVMHIQYVHRDAATVEELSLNAHRDVLEAAVAERLAQTRAIS